MCTRHTPPTQPKYSLIRAPTVAAPSPSRRTSACAPQTAGAQHPPPRRSSAFSCEKRRWPGLYALPAGSPRPAAVKGTAGLPRRAPARDGRRGGTGAAGAHDAVVVGAWGTAVRHRRYATRSGPCHGIYNVWWRWQEQIGLRAQSQAAEAPLLYWAGDSARPGKCSLGSPLYVAYARARAFRVAGPRRNFLI